MKYTKQNIGGNCIRRALRLGKLELVLMTNHEGFQGDVRHHFDIHYGYRTIITTTYHGKPAK